MGIADHKTSLIPTDTFGRPITQSIVMVWPMTTSDPLPSPKPKGRAAFAKFHAKDIRKPARR